MRDPKKKCISKTCDTCNFYRPWDMTDQQTGLRSQVMECSLEVLFKEVPRMRGSIDGCQQATNETHNQVLKFGKASVETLQSIDKNLPKLLR